ncbi:MAG: TPM domain-containing protein [Candidatus Binatia bacterium]|nr:TPM domain-containing protein [Candidatus Binatia bacterium]
MTILRNCLLCVLFLLLSAQAHGADPPLPSPQGLVSDFAGVIDPATRQHLTRLLEELRAKTGAEIAVVTVETTRPLTAFEYAMRIAEAWRPGAKGKDNGVVFLVAVRDRQMFIATGYGVEGVLPDGRVGEIQDDYILPYFRRGEYARGILAGTQVMAHLIAQEYGVQLTGSQIPRPGPRGKEGAPSALDLFLFALIAVALLVAAFTGTRRSRYRRFHGGRYSPVGFGGYGFGGGFGGGGVDLVGSVEEGLVVGVRAEAGRLAAGGSTCTSVTYQLEVQTSAGSVPSPDNGGLYVC